MVDAAPTRSSVSWPLTIAGAIRQRRRRRRLRRFPPWTGRRRQQARLCRRLLIVSSLQTPPPTVTNSCIPVNHFRSRAAIQTLVQRRVHERNNWTVTYHDDEIAPPSQNPVAASTPTPTTTTPPLLRRKHAEFPVLAMDWNRLRQRQHWQGPSSSSFEHDTETANDENTNNDRSIQITWLGHSSLLVQMNGCTLLTDPMFANRCSPLQWIGPHRYQPPPCTVEELCHNLASAGTAASATGTGTSTNHTNTNSNDSSSNSIDLVLISHNHYDHLDFTTVQEIVRCAPNVQFVVPLGMAEWFRAHVSASLNLYELDWHERMEFTRSTASSVLVKSGTAEEPDTQQKAPPTLSVTSLPMRHWTMRTTNRDETLWCGYSVSSQSILQNSNASSSSNNNNAPKDMGNKFLFAGDTAWFDDLVDLGHKYGPWDLAAIPIGAYEPRRFMRQHHINVTEAIRMKDAIQAKYAVPIHWGTFPLTSEPILEPCEKLLDLMSLRDDADSFTPWLIGETKQF